MSARFTPTIVCVALAAAWASAPPLSAQTPYGYAPASGPVAPNLGAPPVGGDWQPPAPGSNSAPAAPAEAGRYPLPGAPTNQPSPWGPQANLPAGPPSGAAAANRPAASHAKDLFEPAKIIAIIGDQPILAGDVLGDVNRILAPYEAEAPPEVLDQHRVKLMQQMVERMIDTKVLYLEFLRKVPADKRSEVESSIRKAFDESQLESMLERAKVSSPQELDAELRKIGSSLDKQRRRFGEQVIARQLLQKAINADAEVSHEQMLAYYREHAAEFEFPAQARWEHLMVRYDRFPSKADAYRAIADLGNQVLGGAPLDAVARRHSQAPDAEEGGQNDWTTQGSLAWKQVDAALFSLPLNRLSQIIADDRGFHIVRVLERKEAGRTDFVEAQVKIKEKIREQLIEGRAQEYIDKVRRETFIWTIFDDEASATASAPASPTTR